MTQHIKVTVNVTIPTPKPSLEKQSKTEQNETLRDLATELVIDALSIAQLNPVVLRARLTKGDK